MEPIGLAILNEFARPAVYTTTAGVASNVRAAIRDRGARARVGRGVVLTSDAVATVSDAQAWEEGATLAQGGTVYRIERVQVGAPGSVMLGLVRVSGAKLEAPGISEDIINEFGKPMVWQGQTIQAHIVHTAVRREIRQGVVVDVVHTMAHARVIDAAGIQEGDNVSIAGRVYSVRSKDRDGFGLVALTLD